MGIIELGTLINLYVSTPGRRTYAFREVRRRAKERGLTKVVKRIDVALAHEKKTAELETTWGSEIGASRTLPSEIDPQIDRILLLIEIILQHLAADADSGVATVANELMSSLFPHTANVHTRLPFIDQLAANERVLSVLEASEWARWVETFGLLPHVTRLRELNDQFQQALRERDQNNREVSYGEVREARARGQKHLVQVTAIIGGMFSEDEDAEERTELLQPIMEQNEAIRAYRLRRRRVVEINADTGEPVEPDAADAPADAGADDIDSAEAAPESDAEKTEE